MQSEKWKQTCIDLFRMVSREDWGASPPKWEMPEQSTPQESFYTTFAKTYWCKHDEDCRKIVHDLQQKHMDEGHPDIQYNFLVGGDGNVYEGAGWNYTTVDLSRPEFNRYPKVIIATLGRPTESRYMRRTVRTVDRFISYGVAKKMLLPGRKFKYTAIG
ncbi:peptidoglycan-recognition protein SC1a/b-like [Macrosteles quadrilineatus]|uniref:peptidoglycan-recognition protein SC1a/b-like n=1 Tax=Macrosteles quadrilineatus TaxID=74068 RepID=UPI0023E0A6DE|nr:peptidoglycan-recognition protein SC1a/b-like [Macrosteles quadrilineatus]